jgi:hypothetical protein
MQTRTLAAMGAMAAQTLALRETFELLSATTPAGMVGKRRTLGRNSRERKAMSAQDDEKTEDEQDAKSSDEHDAKTEDEHDGDKQDSSDEHDSDDKQDSDDDDDDKFTGEHGEDMSEIGQVSRDKVSDEPSEEGKEEVKKIAEAYGDKKTAVMPGTDRTITGTAVNEWLDDEGNPKFGDPDEHPFAKDEDGDGDSEDSDGDSEDSNRDSEDSSNDESKDNSEESKESADQD